ncbi:hypothetical protein EOD04_14330 [Mesorhizobium sp. M2C.T.Ca.TU.009.01.2.1]|nr:hypothetical protein EOD04_14330 [Mesorhizobium sp. M2C.T.Ca.TU.009.01.2.1]
MKAKEISSKPTSSPAMANTVDLHLLPRIDPQNDTRRTSSPGGCCCFWRRQTGKRCQAALARNYIPLERFKPVSTVSPSAQKSSMAA